MEEVEQADSPNKGPGRARGPEQGAVTPTGRKRGWQSTAPEFPTRLTLREQGIFQRGHPQAQLTHRLQRDTRMSPPPEMTRRGRSMAGATLQPRFITWISPRGT